MSGEKISKATMEEAFRKLDRLLQPVPASPNVIGICARGARFANSRPWRRSKRTAWGQVKASHVAKAKALGLIDR